MLILIDCMLKLVKGFLGPFSLWMPHIHMFIKNGILCSAQRAILNPKCGIVLVGGWLSQGQEGPKAIALAVGIVQRTGVEEVPIYIRGWAGL